VKIRNGFVSNSSSSSFVVVGFETSIDNIEDEHVHLLLSYEFEMTSEGGNVYFRPVALPITMIFIARLLEYCDSRFLLQQWYSRLTCRTHTYHPCAVKPVHH
jgi:hypothetical protein